MITATIMKWSLRRWKDWRKVRMRRAMRSFFCKTILGRHGCCRNCAKLWTSRNMTTRLITWSSSWAAMQFCGNNSRRQRNAKKYSSRSWNDVSTKLRHRRRSSNGWETTWGLRREKSKNWFSTRAISRRDWASLRKRPASLRCLKTLI